MVFRMRLLCKTLNQYKRIIIYGTGDYALEVYPQLIEGNLKEKLVCFAQTVVDRAKSIDGIPVVDIRTLTYDRTESVVLVAVSKMYVEEIKNTLLDNEYLNIVSLPDYQVDYRRTEEEFGRLLGFEEQCECIADWYVKTHIGNVKKKEIFDIIMNRSNYIDEKRETNLIVMICGHLSPRVLKIVGALKQKQYDITMLSYCRGENKWCTDELRKYDIRINQCKCIEEMFYNALQYHPLVYFFEPRWGDCQWAEVVIKDKQYFGKVIIDLYDVINDGFTGQTEKNLMAERYVLEHADGIVWRWFSKAYLEEKGFKYQGKSIQFIDYCDYKGEDSFSYEADDTVLKLCTITGYGDEYAEERPYVTEYAEWARLDEILARVGNKEDCIFHFYAGHLSDSNIERCEKMEKQYKNFRFFLNTQYNRLLKNLSYYDYGCDLWTNGKEPSDDCVIGEYYGSLYRNSIRNVYFDFLGAGLPVVTTNSEKMWQYLSAYDVVVKMNLSSIDIDYLKQHKNYYRTEVAKARKEIDIDNQIPRLIQFFNEV